MRFSFRKRVKIAPGIYVNLGKKGVSSLSVGAKGATVNFKGKTDRHNLVIGRPMALLIQNI
ncbi:DUF4236 domain-containing protein [Pseudomonas helleri]|uniref:DUF4236 domain-containing protein n=1 Tax=Pseudomonas helleri TaxID=1608996 RepID=A0ABW9PNI6_9PSED|nr:DUF4236 domain-containing protein [Pseudomonas helleri]MQT28830.1 DUF4236 domain-containing protein [Pseudomonas helleri]